VSLGDVLREGRLALPRRPADQRAPTAYRAVVKPQKVVGGTAERLACEDVRVAVIANSEPVGVHVDEQVGDLLPVDVDLAELHPLVLVPLHGGDLADEFPQADVLAIGTILGDQVAHELPAGEHVGVLPEQVVVGVVDHPVDRLTPQAGHLLAPVLLGMLVEAGVEGIERAGVVLAGAGDVRHERIAADTGFRQTIQLLRLTDHGLVEPVDRVPLLAVDRPLDLVHQ
jgi:hypothetical protein